MIDVATENLIAGPSMQPRFSSKKIYIVILVIGLAGLLLANKGMVVAAIVNGKPIFRWELNKTLVSRFGKQTLEGIISERLIADAAKKAGVVVSKEDVEAKETEIVSGLAGDVKLEELLKLQGLTKEDFDNQIRLQLTVEKLLSKDVSTTEDDITSYIATNRATLVATDEATLRVEARAAIINQQVSEKIQPWFMELKDSAKIVRFIQ
ncbi:MAG: PpiC-type peptidyl-prolyl cis-trans isomerase [Candidatus Gottesmanbacteria bacterium GW2011_GWA2_47_9]|nr:MAG: PpiC-type peptidyl-prolyl cis-trans isomerase [Candidatus Gottesmanbacteria bacterium GW2011_GWA2_47_9]